jgi:hypothetical protein
LRRAVARAWKAAEGSRSKKARVRVHESAGQIPSPLYPLTRHLEKMSCTTLGVRAPHAIYPDADKGAWGPPVS